MFAEHATWASEQRAWLAIMAGGFEPRFDELAGAQCLHGEVHPANVLFRAADGTAILVDFEESVHVFAPPAWDLAFLVQRFCLRDNPPAVVRAARLSIVAEAYGRPLPALARMMRQAAWFSIAVILEARISQGLVTPRDEYEKFVRLEQQGQALESVL
jgi:Ser/Thr protein kinase RdoA (MazF antagonist)